MQRPEVDVEPSLRVAILTDRFNLDDRARAVVGLLVESQRADLLWVGAWGEPTAKPPSLAWLRYGWLLAIDQALRAATGKLRPLQDCRSSFPSLRYLEAAEWRALLASRSAGREILLADDSTPDVLIVLAAHKDQRFLAELSGVTVWWFDADGGCTGMAVEGFQAVARREPISRVALMQRRAGAAESQTLGIAEFRTHSVSPLLNQSGIRAVSSRLVDDALASLAEHNTGLKPPADAPALTANSDPPTLRQSLSLFARTVGTTLMARALTRPRQVQWSIAMGRCDDCDWEAGRFDRLRWLEPDAGRFIADPFPVEHDGRTFVFVEELEYRDRKGYLSVIEVDGSGSCAPCEPVLMQPYHLSFPYVFRVENEFFMLPEQGDSGELVLYRSHDFPRDWRPHATLLHNVQAADPVIFEHGGYWWLFLSRAENSSHDNNLQLYYAKAFDGPYIRHPMSPVRERLMGSRMAGSVFESQGRLIRPAQDCVAYYGAALAFFEIQVLSPDAYTERLVRHVEPDARGAFGKGLHTFNRTDSVYVIDGFRYMDAWRG